MNKARRRILRQRRRRARYIARLPFLIAARIKAHLKRLAPLRNTEGDRQRIALVIDYVLPMPRVYIQCTFGPDTNTAVELEHGHYSVPAVMRVGE